MLEKYIKYGKLVELDKGYYLCREGFELNYVTIILEGICKVTRQQENGNIMSFGFYNNDGIIGDLETVSDSNIASTSVVTISKFKGIRIPLKKSKELMKNDIKYSNLLAMYLAQKLYSSSHQTTQNILLPLEERLTMYLINTYPNKIFEGNLVQISQELGTSYRHLLRTIRKLKDEKKLIQTDHKKRFIINL